MDRQVIDRHASSLEFFSWALVVCCVLTFGVPSYNATIGIWGAYCAHCKNGRVAFRGILITSFALLYELMILVVVTSHILITLPLVTLILIKGFMIYFECHLLSSLGGYSSLATDGSGTMQNSAYANLVASTASMGASSTGGTGYYPPDDLSHSLVMEGGNQHV